MPTEPKNLDSVAHTKEPWKFTPGTKDDMGLHCAHTTDERKHACVNALANIPDPGAFVEQAKKLMAEREAERVARIRDGIDRERDEREEQHSNGPFGVGA